jgi:hypothetical protein
MTLTATCTNLLTGITERQIRAMTPHERRLLSDQLIRVYRMIEGERIMAEAREATAPQKSPSPREGVLAQLASTGGRQA